MIRHPLLQRKDLARGAPEAKASGVRLYTPRHLFATLLPNDIRLF